MCSDKKRKDAFGHLIYVEIAWLLLWYIHAAGMFAERLSGPIVLVSWHHIDNSLTDCIVFVKIDMVK